MSAPAFIREPIPAGWRYATPAGPYTICEGVSGWVVATPGQLVGQYGTLALAESALDADVKQRMWS